MTAGGAAYAIADLFMDVPEATVVRLVLLGGALATGALILLEATSKGTPQVEAALHQMIRGTYKDRFWFGVLVGVLTPVTIVLIALGDDMGPALPAAAGVAALAGMWAYEDSFVRAGQSVPLS